MSSQPSQDPGPIGGQALLEGVMMRRGEAWGAAVRCEDGSIATTHRDLPAGLARWRKVPLIRGVLAIAESAGLGTKAMVWAAQERTESGGPERSDPGSTARSASGSTARSASGSGYSRGGLAASTVVALVLAIGVFGLLPAVIVKAIGIESSTMFGIVEGVVRLAILVAYLGLLSLSPQVRRVFAYHGAEHMTIHAFEHERTLDPAGIRSFDRRHPRCGTSFLLLVVAVTIVAHIAIGNPSWSVLVASRILGLPVVAGISYEVIRFAGRHQSTWYGRLLMTPGFWLQGLTTREPDDAMIEVAVAALEATVAPHSRSRPDAAVSAG